MITDSINVLVVEDKLLIAVDIASKLRKHALNVTGICASGEEAVDHVYKERPDLILMDIQLSGKMDGIAAAATLKRHYNIPIIYLSDFTDSKTLERAKKTLPENYLSKPFQEPDLIRAIDLAFHNFNNRPSEKVSLASDFIFLRTESQAYVKIPVKEILFLEADRAYCKVICKEKTHTMTTSMNHIHEQIKNADFVKVHRSFVVNLANIDSFEGNFLKIGGSDIPINKEGKDIITSRLNLIK